VLALQLGTPVMHGVVPKSEPRVGVVSCEPLAGGACRLAEQPRGIVGAQGTEGASLSKELSIPQAALVIRKGFHKDVDSYSAFTEADGKTTTGLAAYLKARNIKRVFVAGLATDFCVAWTALDARKAGFETYVVEDACRGIDTQGSLAKAWADMAKAGVKRIQSGDIAVGT